MAARGEDLRPRNHPRRRRRRRGAARPDSSRSLGAIRGCCSSPERPERSDLLRENSVFARSSAAHPHASDPAQRFRAVEQSQVELPMSSCSSRESAPGKELPPHPSMREPVRLRAVREGHCAAIQTELIESELSATRKALTGAAGLRRGKLSRRRGHDLMRGRRFHRPRRQALRILQDGSCSGRRRAPPLP